MTILLTGGTGKTGAPLARLLSTKTDHTILVASRKGTIPNNLGIDQTKGQVHGVVLDWFDRTTWAEPFSYTNAHDLPAIDRIMLVATSQSWDVGFINEFIDFARERGVKRFVLLSASQFESGDMAMGQIHAYLKQLGEGGLEFTVLRPTWFSENFGSTLQQMIRDERVVRSVCGDGKIPFVSAEDIAEAAFKGLIDEPSPNTDWILHGPELFSYDDATQLLSTILGRTITHIRITKEDYIKFLDDLGYPELGRSLAEAELKIAKGSEEAIFGHEKAIAGKVTLKQYFEGNKRLWVKED